MRKLSIVSVSVMLVLSLCGTAGANLLTDAGFDTMAVQELTWGGSPWWGGSGGGASSGGGGWITDGQAQSPSHSATLFVYGSDWAYAMVAQTLASGVTPGAQYTASASLRRTADLADGSAAIKVEWLNGSGGTIATDTGTAFNNAYAAGSWHALSEAFTAPGGAAGAKFEVVFSKPTAADPGDIWIDDAGFAETIPEPASAGLLGIALFGIVWGRRVRRNR